MELSAASSSPGVNSKAFSSAINGWETKSPSDSSDNISLVDFISVNFF